MRDKKIRACACACVYAKAIQVEPLSPIPFSFFPFVYLYLSTISTGSPLDQPGVVIINKRQGQGQDRTGDISSNIPREVDQWSLLKS